MGAYLENIVYNELVYRGYDVKIGNIENGEIDFIALKAGKKEYYQVCYYLADDKIIAREFDVYENIKDNYPKYVISMDKFDMSQNGIIHKNIIDWLLECEQNINKNIEELNLLLMYLTSLNEKLYIHNE